MSSAKSTLSALEVSVRCTGTSLLGGQNVGIHAQAHTATGLSPFKTGVNEDLVKSLFLSLSLDKTRARDNHGTLDVVSNLSSLDDIGGGSQILNSSVGARSNEHLVDRNVLHGRSSGQAHILKHSTAGSLLALGAEGLRIGNTSSNRNDILGTSSPSKSRNDILAVDEDIDIVLGSGVRLERLPVSNSLIPSLRAILGGQGAALEVFKGDVIGSNHASTGTTLNGHVADGHTSLHAQVADDRSTELNDRAGTSSSTDLADGVEDDILGADTGGQLAVDLYPHVLAALGDKALSSKDVLDLTGTDTKGQCTEGAMCRSVAVTAHNGGSGESEALLGTDDMDNSLSLVPQAEICDTKLLNILLQSDTLCA
jgi:hypothetical protein